MSNDKTIKFGVMVVAVLGFLAPALATASAAPGTEAPLKWGMNVAAVDPLAADGAKPHYALVWVGVWNDGNWASVDRTLASLRDKGVTPVIQWYYWGDDISPECVENGCWSSLHGAHKSRERWDAMVHDLGARIGSIMGGRETIVIVETEFNKNGIVDTSYASTFDAYMRAHHDVLHKTPGVKTITGFGTWWPQGWARFPQTVAGSDYVAMQALRSSVRSSLDYYLTAADYLVQNAETMNGYFPGKPIFITDMGYSSYPEPEYAEHQNTVITSFFQRVPDLQARGVKAFMYRGLYDVPMNTANYHGEAERWWGFLHQDGSAKPAYATWLKGVGATPPPGVAVPARVEAEAMKASAGGLQKDSSASGGAAWNLWSNGQLTEHVNATENGTYRFTITARGSSAFSEWPAMSARLANNPVGAWSVASSAYAQYAFDADLVAGESTKLQVAFTNDKYDPATKEDRNLIVDRVDVTLVKSTGNRAPTAAFSWAADGLVASFDARASSDPDGDALSYAWSYGDGATGTGATSSRTYTAEGTYNVTLTVTDARGATASTTGSVTLTRANTAPAAAFSWSADGLTVTLDASGTTDAEGDPVTYAWDLGDGNTTTGRVVTHAFADSGSYRVTLTATDDRGASGTSEQVVSVARPNRAPTAAFTATAKDLTVAFDASASADADGDALSYAWEFGDGTTGSGVTPSKAYARAGTYAVKLTVSDGKASATVTGNVTVQAPAAYPIRVEAEAFSVKTTGGRFSDSRASGGAAWNVWSNGEIRHGVSVPESGTHLVTVVAKGTPAAGANARMEVRVNGAAVATFDVTDAWSSYPVRVPLTAGTHTLAVAFVNDYYDSKTREDRNLHVDVVSVERASAVALAREAEDFGVKSTGGRYSDTAASAGAGWNLWSNGHAEDSFTVDAAGAYRLSVVAKGDAARNTQARMQVSVNGVLVADTHVTGSYAPYDVDLRLAPGQHVVRVAFVNDFFDSKTREDRNLRVDVVRLTAP